MIKYADLVRPAKAILISPPRDGITAQDWPKFYRLVPRYFAFYSRFQFYRVTPVEYLHGVGLNRLEVFFSEFHDLYQSLLAAHPGQQISSEQIDDLLRSLGNAKLLGKISPAEARSYLETLFGRILGSTPAHGARFNLNQNSFSRINENIRFGLEGLRANEALFRIQLGDSDFLSRGLKREEISSVPAATLLNATLLKNKLSFQAVDAVKRSPFEVGTVFQRDSLNVIIPKNGIASQFSHSHVAKIHLLRMVNRLLLQAYGSPRTSRLSSDQIKRLLGELFPILEKLEIVDKELRAKVEKRVFEASLFLFSSDGQPGLSMIGALELEALVLATFDRAPRIQAAIGKDCGVKVEDEKTAPKKKPILIDPACYRSTFVSRHQEFWSYIPGFVDYLQAHPRFEQEQVFARLEAFLRKDLLPTQKFTLADSQAFVLMPYYVEILFARFDQNRDGLIDTSEGDVAYPVFRPFIALKAGEKGYTSADDHAAIYNYLLANRLLPTDDTMDYIVRRYLLGRQEFTIDRAQMVEIFQKLLSL
jgi:hypothetical protein